MRRAFVQMNDCRYNVFFAVAFGEKIRAIGKKLFLLFCSNNGYKVGIFSYNILLSEYLKEQFPKNKYPNLIADAIMEWLLQYCKDLKLIDKDFDPMVLPKDQMQKFYNHDIYKIALEAFQMKPLDLDVLILDEAQDYVEPNKLILLSLMLKNNLARGKWYMFDVQIFLRILSLHLSTFFLEMKNQIVHYDRQEEVFFHSENIFLLLKQLHYVFHWLLIYPKCYNLQG